MRKGLHYIQIGRLTLCWRDAWTKRWGLEITWGKE
jgi:hypothetical protein